MPFISICIPTYNSGDKLVRLLKSIEVQTFTDYEIIISDDSNNDEIPQLIEAEFKHLNIKYYHNARALGTPNNWNNAVANSTGDWINLMHHDDWYDDKKALQVFADMAKKRNDALLIFCAYNHYHLHTNKKDLYYASLFDRFLLKLNYLSFYKHFIGNPSTTLVNKRYKPYKYDVKFKWLIDYDFVTTLLAKENSFAYVKEVLVNLGMHSEQVTASVFQNPSYEIPESMFLIEKHGDKILNNFFVYDFFWRMYRNLKISSIQDFNSYLSQPCTNKKIINIINKQTKYSNKQLKNKLFSKIIIIYNYSLNFFTQ